MILLLLFLGQLSSCVDSIQTKQILVRPVSSNQLISDSSKTLSVFHHLITESASDQRLSDYLDGVLLSDTTGVVAREINFIVHQASDEIEGKDFTEIYIHIIWNLGNKGHLDLVSKMMNGIVESELTPDNLFRFTKERGHLFEVQGGYPEAIELYTEALNLAMNLENPRHIFNAYISILSVYIQLKDYQSALRYTELGLRFLKHHPDITSIEKSRFYVNAGITYRRLSDFTESEKMYLNALNISKALYDPLLLAQINSNLGNLYKDMGDYDRALTHYRTSVELSETMNNKIGESINFINMGSAYRLKGDYEDSRFYLNKADSLLKSTSQNGLKRILYAEFVELGNFSSDTWMSAVYKELYDEVNANINSMEKQNELLRTSNLLNLKVLDSEIKQKRTELELARKRNQILWILIVSLLIIILLYTIYSTVQRRLLFELYHTRFQHTLLSGLPVLPLQNDRSTLSEFRIIRSIIEYFRTPSSDPFQDRDENSTELISESVNEDGLEAYYKALVVYLNQLESFENQQFTLDELAYRIGTNSKYLSLSVRKYSGLNYSDFINSFKVKRCVQAINQSPSIKTNLKQIQDVGGFKSKATFLRAFKKVTGLTPAQYQKQFHHLKQTSHTN